MIYLGVLLGIGIMAAMVYMIFDKKSNRAVRLACLIALGVMVLTVIVCLVIVFTDNRVPVDVSTLIVGAEPETKPKNSTNSMVLILLIIFLIAFFVFIAFTAMHENKKNLQKKQGGFTSLL